MDDSKKIAKRNNFKSLVPIYLFKAFDGPEERVSPQTYVGAISLPSENPEGFYSIKSVHLKCESAQSTE